MLSGDTNCSSTHQTLSKRQKGGGELPFSSPVFQRHDKGGRGSTRSRKMSNIWVWTNAENAHFGRQRVEAIVFFNLICFNDYFDRQEKNSINMKQTSLKYDNLSFRISWNKNKKHNSKRRNKKSLSWRVAMWETTEEVMFHCSNKEAEFWFRKNAI